MDSFYTTPPTVTIDSPPNPIYELVTRYIFNEVIIKWSSDSDSDCLSIVIEKVKFHLIQMVKILKK